MRALPVHRPPVNLGPAADAAGARIEPCASVEQPGWLALRERACTEFASDAPLENMLSHAVHKALGLEETERVVYFRRSLP